MSDVQFGAGQLFVTPQINAAGEAIATPSSLEFAVMQAVDVDMSFTSKTLYGARQYPIAVARAEGKFEFKVKIAAFDAHLFGTFLLGTEATPGIRAIKTMDPITADATVAPPSSGTFTADLGVVYATTGKRLKRVDASPAAGEYTVTTGGAYAFNTGEQATAKLVTYEYTATSSTAYGGTIQNELMGNLPIFGARFQVGWGGKGMLLTLLNCASSQFSKSHQNNDFTNGDVTFEAFSGASNVLGYYSDIA